jgi:hypothetical protein
MGAYYCDSSALVKRYAGEIGSLWVRSLTEIPRQDIPFSPRTFPG